MKLSFSITTFLVLCATKILSMQRAVGDPRTQLVRLTCRSQSNYTSKVEVDNFLSTMDSVCQQLQASGYGVAATGSGSDASYGLVQCFGDISPVDCVMCYAEARTLLPLCPNKNFARAFLDGCFVGSDNYSFFHEFSGPEDAAVCGNSTGKDSVAFGAATKKAVRQAVRAAAAGDGFARAAAAVPANGSVFVLADCWKTLNRSSCRACLASASASVLGCLPMSEGRALNTGCFIRYSETNFLNDQQPKKSSLGTALLIGVAVVSFVVVLGVGVAILVHISQQKTVQKKRRVNSADVERLMKVLSISGLNFKYSILEKATGSFHETNKLGQGGFGTVYKGVLADGREIAVKRLNFNNRQKSVAFYNEVDIVSSIEHKNVVRLLGCSCSGPESLLVYEFLPNQSVDQFIFDPDEGKLLNWEKRHNIILGTAEGLTYLHENANATIVHRDIKASNILLDSNFCAKIGDFGLARSFQKDESHISTTIAGTLGYIAPEYVVCGRFTKKADVYSFGMLLLEIVTGQKSNIGKLSDMSQNLILHAWKHFREGTANKIIDPNLQLHNHLDGAFMDDVLRVVHIGLLCTQETPSLRPEMSRVLKMLKQQDADLPAPTSPPYMHK